MLKSKHRDKVFVAGGLPSVTYVERREQNAQRDFARAVATPNQIASLSGATKTGKSVLCRKVLGKREYVWIDGGEVASIDALWEKICAELNVPAETEHQHESTDNVSSSAGVKAGLVFTASGSHLEKSSTRTKMRSISMSGAIDVLLKDGIALVIDDFHYLNPEARSAFMKNIKGAIFNGLKVVLLSVTHRTFDAIKAESELTGRLMSTIVPSWQPAELMEIPRLGFEALTADCPVEITEALIREAQESPLLMQRFCWEICYDCDIEFSRTFGRHKVPENYDLDSLFQRISRDAGLPIYEQLVTGPQSRKARKKRMLKTGKQVDIYELTLLALARTGPTSEISYEEIRNAMGEMMHDRLPQKHEVTAAIKHLAAIARRVGTEAAIDWNEDKRVVNLMDPYLRFFLRWQVRHPHEQEAHDPDLCGDTQLAIWRDAPVRGNT